MAAFVLDSINGCIIHHSFDGRWFGCTAIRYDDESALPFTLIMLLLCWGLLKALRLDVTKMQALQEARITPRAVQNPRSWQQRLGLIMHYPHSLVEVQHYIQHDVIQAF